MDYLEKARTVIQLEIDELNRLLQRVDQRAADQTTGTGDDDGLAVEGTGLGAGRRHLRWDGHDAHSGQVTQQMCRVGIVEEAAEVWMAAEYEGREKTAEEISQLLYHLQVMMLACDLELEDVYRYL